MSESLDLKDLGRRFDEAYKWKLNWMAMYEQFWWYVCPNRNALNMIYSFKNDGAQLTNLIYDNSAMLAARQRAFDLVGLMMPKDRRWGQLTFNPAFVSADDISRSQPFLDDVNENIFWYINNSNLYRAAGSSALDLNAGTGALYVESMSDANPLVFMSIPAICLFIEASYDDVVGTCWFKRNFNAVQFQKTFPKYRGKLLDKIKSDDTQMVPVIYGQVKLKEDSYYMYAVPEEDRETALFERTRDYNQIIIFRDQVRPGEPEGRGVGIDMLPTIIDLNHTVRDRRKFLDFTANPPMFYTEGEYFNPFSIRQWSGAFIPRTQDGRNPLEPLQMPNNMDVWQQINDSREFIRRGFQVDPLGDINVPTKTATEIAARENRAQRSTITDLGRLENEMAKQIYEICVRILMDRGLINLKELSKKQAQFEWQSPLTDLQKQQDFSNFMQNCQFKQQFMGQGAALGSMNVPRVNTWLTEIFNLPSDLFINEEQVKDLMTEIAQMGEQGMPTPSTAAQPVMPIDSPEITRTNIAAGQQQ